MEDMRKRKMEDLATLLQKTWRCWHHRQRFLKMKASEVKIAAIWRKYKVSLAPLALLEQCFFQ
jgi:myosin-1